MRFAALTGLLFTVGLLAGAPAPAPPGPPDSRRADGPAERFTPLLLNVVEQIVSFASEPALTVEDLPHSIVTAVLGTVTRSRERRRQVADDLYESLVSGEYDFWRDMQPLFLNRDITRRDLREVIRSGLRASAGSYRALLTLFHIDPEDYKRFLNFLSAHDLRVDFREFRSARPSVPAEPEGDAPARPYAH